MMLSLFRVVQNLCSILCFVNYLLFDYILRFSFLISIAGAKMEFEPSFPRGGREKIKSAVPEKPLKRKQVDDVNKPPN
jgi:hypothetical protein